MPYILSTPSLNPGTALTLQHYPISSQCPLTLLVWPFWTPAPLSPVLLLNSVARWASSPGVAPGSLEHCLETALHSSQQKKNVEYSSVRRFSHCEGKDWSSWSMWTGPAHALKTSQVRIGQQSIITWCWQAHQTMLNSLHWLNWHIRVKAIFTFA